MKLLSGSLIMLFFLMNTEIVIGQTDQYTRVFEEEVTSNNCRNIICQIKNYGGQRVPFTYEAPVATGSSSTAWGTTITHSENRTFHSSYETASDWACTKCRERYYFSTPRAPSVYFFSHDDVRTMKIDTSCAGSPHFCIGQEYDGLSKYYGSSSEKKEEREKYMRLLKEIFRKASPKGKDWVTGFKLMWEAARSLDDPGFGTLSLFHVSKEKKDKEETDEVIRRRITNFEIEENSCSCTIQ